MVRSLGYTGTTWGYHECEFCGNARSSSEFDVPGNQVVYTAPHMISHYVEQHDYLPPQEFIEAVLASPPGTDEYNLALDAIRSRRIYPPGIPLLGPTDPFPNTQVSTSSIPFPVLTLRNSEIARRDSINELSHGRVHDLREMRGYEIVDSEGRRLFVRAARESRDRGVRKTLDRILNPIVEVELKIDLLDAAVLLPSLKARLIRALRHGRVVPFDEAEALMRKVDEASDFRGVIAAIPPSSR